MAEQNRALGIGCAIAVIFIWSGFIVVSRAGVLSALTPQDMIALRFAVAGLATLPFAYAWWPRHLPLHIQAVIALSGPGICYSFFMYTGLGFASAAYGGVFANGSLPLFTMLLVYVILRKAPGTQQAFGVAVIMLGGVLLGWRGMTLGGANVVLGICLFLGASAVLAVYIFTLQRWRIGPKQALAVVNIPNAFVYLPLWYFFLPSGMAETNTWMIVLQGLFQGLGPGFLAVMLFALAAVHLGATATSGFSAAVPAAVAVLAIPTLNEIPTPLEWAGVALVSVGLFLLIGGKDRPMQAPKTP